MTVASTVSPLAWFLARYHAGPDLWHWIDLCYRMECSRAFVDYETSAMERAEWSVN